MTDPIPAATLILLRDRADGPPQVLMVERARTMAFAGGALVFPGGRIDPGDHALAKAMGNAELAPKLAAIRETIEEAGVTVGATPPPDLAAARVALAAGATLGMVIDGIDPDALVPYARWKPDFAHARVFDTWFYVARVVGDSGEPVVDATENVRAFWATPNDALDAAAVGEARLLFPTRRVLERLATHESVDAAMAAARAWPVRTITPWTDRRDGVDMLCIPDDLGYPVTAEPVDTAFRG